MASPHTPSRRTLRACAWALTATAALLAVVWVGSMKTYVMAYSPPQLVVSINEGCVTALWYTKQRLEGRSSVEFRVMDNWGAYWSFVIRDHQLGTQIFTERSAPLWPFVLATGVPGVWVLVKTRPRRYANLCPACGYDRTGLPTVNSENGTTTPAPCPECGKGA